MKSTNQGLTRPPVGSGNRKQDDDAWSLIFTHLRQCVTCRYGQYGRCKRLPLLMQAQKTTFLKVWGY